MKIVWDEPKRQTNLAIHGLDLADAESFEWENALFLAGHPGQDGRLRFRAIGLLNGEAVAVVFGLLSKEAVTIIIP